MPLADNDYARGADDTLKDLIDTLESVIEDGKDGGVEGIQFAIDIANQMRRDLY